MAFLKDTVVAGDLRVTDTIYGDVPLADLVDADDLKAIEALTGTSGILTKTAANTWTLNSGATPASHAHGNITNAGAIGTAANKGVYTTTNGVLTAGTIPVAAGGTGQTTAAGIFNVVRDNGGNSTWVNVSGDTMTGTLNMTPASGEGGEIHLNASTANTTQAGIALDQLSSTFRIFGIASADGTTKTGTGTPLVIDPYAKTITGGYTLTGALTGHASSDLALSGGTLTGGLEIKGHIAGDSGSTGHGLYGGGGYHSAYNNIILHGDGTTGSSGIAFISDKGDTTINQPSDRAFIQFHAYGITTASAEGTNPTLATTGENNRLVIGVGNDATDQVWLQTPGVNGLIHQVGATSYVIPSLNNTQTTANYPLVSTTTAGLYTNNTSITLRGKAINQILTGSGTAATTSGSNYVPAKWTFNTGSNATDGDMYTIKIPVAGHDYGIFMSVNNGTNYYPVVIGSTGRVTTHYPVNTYIQVIFEASGSAASMFPVAGGTSRVTVTGGVFRVLNYYDSGNSGLYQNYSPKAYKIGTTATTAYDLLAEDATGLIVPAHKVAHRVGSPIYIASSAKAANATGTWWDMYQRHYNMLIRKDGTNLATTAYNPIYLKGTIANGIFTPDTTTPYVFTKAGCNVTGAYYMFVGDAQTSASYINYNDSHPYYYYNGSNLLLYTEYATTASAFAANKSITLSGDTTGSASSTGGWTITTKTDRLSTEGDNRGVATTPNDYTNKIIFKGLKTNSVIGSPSSDSYSYLIGLRGWSDSSGGNSHEIAFNNTGIYVRNGATTSWGSWRKIVTGSFSFASGNTITGNGSSTTFNVTHAFNTRDVIVQVYDLSTYETIQCDAVRTDNSTVTITFASAPANGKTYRVLISSMTLLNVPDVNNNLY